MMAGRLVNCAEKAALLITEMPKQLADAADAIGLAETEFSSKAFAPFWDAVETAANSLGHLHSAIEKASRLTRGYRDQLAEPAVMNHDFPVPSEFLPDVPEPTLVLQALARVVRQGQTNIDFALVWEHRQTRKVLIAGFQTLGEAIRDLGSQIDSSFGELQGCIASSARQLADESRDSLAGASEQQLKLQREQDGKLDNIQRGRYLPP